MTMSLIATINAVSNMGDAVFDNIPQDGTDLFMTISTRSTRSAATDEVRIRINLDEAGNYTYRTLIGDGSTASSTSAGPTSDFRGFTIPAASATTSTFSNSEIYISNYTSAAAKSISINSVTENNATAATQEIRAGLWNNTSAITRLDIRYINGLFVTGSSFSLYKITKGSDGTTVVS